MSDRVPDYEPDDAAAQLVAEEFADAAREYATEEARDDAAAAWFGQHYGPFGTS